MQSNKNINDDDICIVNDSVWNNLFDMIINGKDIVSLTNYTNNISKQYNIDKKNIIKDFLNFIIRNKEFLNIPEYFKFVENIIHFEDCKNSHYVNYSLIKLSKLLKES
jgi:hypothetical protein